MIMQDRMKTEGCISDDIIALFEFGGCIFQGTHFMIVNLKLDA